MPVLTHAMIAISVCVFMNIDFDIDGFSEFDFDIDRPIDPALGHYSQSQRSE